MPLVIRQTPSTATTTPRTARLRAFTQSCTCVITARVLAGAANWLASGISTNASATTVYTAAALSWVPSAAPDARMAVSAPKYRKSNEITTPTRNVTQGGPACRASRARVDNCENAVGPAWYDGSSAVAPTGARWRTEKPTTIDAAITSASTPMAI